MRARACVRCKEYVIIHPDNPVNINLVKDFEAKHAYHTIITVDLYEVKDGFIKMESADYKKSVKMGS